MKSGDKFGLFVILSLVLLCSSFASATISLKNSSIQKVYFASEPISGEINVSIVNEAYDMNINSNLDVTQNVLLGDFINDNGYSGFCSPSDCSIDYSKSNPSDFKNVVLDYNQTKFFGFYIEGSNAVVDEISFNISSDFESGDVLPLGIKFFNGNAWRFDEFSNEYSSPEYGCYSSSATKEKLDLSNARYCEKMHLGDTGKLALGVDLELNSDNKNIEMLLYSGSGSLKGSCVYNPSSTQFCEVSPSSSDRGLFSEADYFVCVEADETNYEIYSEDSSDNCGWAQLITASFRVSNFTHDFSIFAKAAKYSSASALTDYAWDYDSIISKANSFLTSKYRKDCSDGCVLPIEIYGVPQNFKIESASLGYFTDVRRSSEQVYDLDSRSARVNFNGILDLNLLNFETKPGVNSFELYFGGNKILEQKINLSSAPIVISISPTNPPAGVPVKFYAEVDYNSNSSLSYDWIFGDGKTERTSTNSVIHSYSTIGNYTLNIKASSGNRTSSKDFLIKTVSPKEAINSSLYLKKKNIDLAIVDMSTFPVWQQAVLKSISGVDSLKSNLNSISARDNSSSDEGDYLTLARELFNLSIPLKVFLSEQSSSPLVSSLSEIDPSPVNMIAGGVADETTLEIYKNPILRWQLDNIGSTIGIKKITMNKDDGSKGEVLYVYSVHVKSSSPEESYFVINKKLDDLTFNPSSVNVKKEGDFSVITLAPNADESFEFYYKPSSYPGSKEANFFVSPKLSKLEISGGNIDYTCNYNRVCEKANGENYNTCRNDCKPVGWLVFWMIWVFFFVLILYTILQVWYKSRYETSLFKDRKRLFNLLMFIANARARGLVDGQIRMQLREKGWNGEEIDYAIKKSLGKRTGMYEIIPLERFFAWRRNKEAEKNIATPSQQQAIPNINKY